MLIVRLHVQDVHIPRPAAPDSQMSTHSPTTPSSRRLHAKPFPDTPSSEIVQMKNTPHAELPSPLKALSLAVLLLLLFNPSTPILSSPSNLNPSIIHLSITLPLAFSKFVSGPGPHLFNHIANVLSAANTNAAAMADETAAIALMKSEFPDVNLGDLAFRMAWLEVMRDNDVEDAGEMPRPNGKQSIIDMKIALLQKLLKFNLDWANTEVNSQAADIFIMFDANPKGCMESYHHLKMVKAIYKVSHIALHCDPKHAIDNVVAVRGFLEPFVAYRDRYLCHPRFKREGLKGAGPPMDKLAQHVIRDASGRTRKTYPLRDDAGGHSITVRFYAELLSNLTEKGQFFYSKNFSYRNEPSANSIIERLFKLVKYIRAEYAHGHGPCMSIIERYSKCKWLNGEESAESDGELSSLAESDEETTSPEDSEFEAEDKSDTASRESTSEEESDTNNTPKICSNCSSERTSGLWVGDEKGGHVCHTCYSYKWSTGIDRPERLWNREKKNSTQGQEGSESRPSLPTDSHKNTAKKRVRASRARKSDVGLGISLSGEKGDTTGANLADQPADFDSNEDEEDRKERLQEEAKERKRLNRRARQLGLPPVFNKHGHRIGSDPPESPPPVWDAPRPSMILKKDTQNKTPTAKTPVAATPGSKTPKGKAPVARTASATGTPKTASKVYDKNGDLTPELKQVLYKNATVTMATHAESSSEGRAPVARMASANHSPTTPSNMYDENGDLTPGLKAVLDKNAAITMAMSRESSSSRTRKKQSDTFDKLDRTITDKDVQLFNNIFNKTQSTNKPPAEKKARHTYHQPSTQSLPKLHFPKSARNNPLPNSPSTPMNPNAPGMHDTPIPTHISGHSTIPDPFALSPLSPTTTPFLQKVRKTLSDNSTSGYKPGPSSGKKQVASRPLEHKQSTTSPPPSIPKDANPTVPGPSRASTKSVKAKNSRIDKSVTNPAANALANSNTRLFFGNGDDGVGKRTHNVAGGLSGKFSFISSISSYFCLVRIE